MRVGLNGEVYTGPLMIWCKQCQMDRIAKSQPQLRCQNCQSGQECPSCEVGFQWACEACGSLEISVNQIAMEEKWRMDKWTFQLMK